MKTNASKIICVIADFFSLNYVFWFFRLNNYIKSTSFVDLHRIVSGEKLGFLTQLPSGLNILMKPHLENDAKSYQQLVYFY